MKFGVFILIPSNKRATGLEPPRCDAVREQKNAGGYALSGKENNLL
jgi:hypothetical protein